MDDIDKTVFSLDKILDQDLFADEVFLNHVKEIDSELDENSRNLEACIRDILDLASDVSETKFYNPVEAVDNLSREKILDKTACYDLDVDVISTFLKRVVNAI